MKQHSVIAQALIEINHETCRGLEHPVVTREVAVVRPFRKIGVVLTRIIPFRLLLETVSERASAREIREIAK